MNRGTALLFLLILGSANSPAADERLQTGIDAFNRGDLIGAMTAFRSAAEGGSAEAQVRLAWILDQAEENAEAVHWYQAASEAGNVDGHAGLASMYAKGEGVPRDPGTALALYQRAANEGHLASIRVLAAAHEKGELGLSVDKERAAYWAAAEQKIMREQEQQEDRDAN